MSRMTPETRKEVDELRRLGKETFSHSMLQEFAIMCDSDRYDPSEEIRTHEIYRNFPHRMQLALSWRPFTRFCACLPKTDDHKVLKAFCIASLDALPDYDDDAELE